MDASGPSRYIHNIGGDSVLDAESDDECIQKLKDLFEHRDGSMAAGCRNTIDSILSKYETVRDEMQQDPRIGLAMSAEFENTSCYDSAIRTQDVFVGLTLAQGPGSLIETYDLRQDGEKRSHEDDTSQDLMLDYAEHLRHATADIFDDKHSLSIDESTLAGDGLNKYDTKDTKATWDDEENTLLDVYADLDDDIFQARFATPPIVDAVQVLDSTATVEPDDIDQKWLLSTASLSMSPIVQVAMTEPFLAVLSVEIATSTPIPRSDDGDDERSAAANEEAVHTSPAAQNTISHPDVPHPPSRDHSSDKKIGETVDIDTMPRHLHNLGNLQRHMDALIAEYTASFSYHIPEDAESAPGGEGLDWSTIENDTADSVPPFVSGIVPSQSASQELVEQINRITQQLSHHTSTPPSFLFWLEDDDATGYVLGAGLGIMLSAIALAGRVFW